MKILKGDRKLSEETKKKMSESHQKRINSGYSLPSKGKTYEELYGIEKANEIRKKMNIYWKDRVLNGFKLSEETKKKMSESQKNKYKNGYIHPNKGKSLIEIYGIEKAKKIRSKMREYQKNKYKNGYIHPNKGKTLIEIYGEKGANEIRKKTIESWRMKISKEDNNNEEAVNEFNKMHKEDR